MTVFFITFYTTDQDGIPCTDLRSAEQKVQSIVKSNVDFYHAYSYQEVKSKCPDAVHNFRYFYMPNEHSGFMGFFKWKPYILLQTMEQMQEGDTLIYKDCNIEKYPQYKTGLEQIRQTTETIFSMIPFPLFVPVEQMNCILQNFIKTSVFKHFHISNEEIKLLPLLNSHLILLKKNSITTQLIQDWWNTCSNHSLLEPLHPEPKDEHYRHSICAHGIWNVLLRLRQLEGILPHNLFTYRLENRYFTIEHIRNIYPNELRLDGCSKFINHIQLRSLEPHYSENCHFWKIRNTYVLYIKSSGPFQWIGYQFNQIGQYKIHFEIQFETNIPEKKDNIGFKTHFPSDHIENEWLTDMKPQIWKTIDFSHKKTTSENEPMILIFDDCTEPNVIWIRNFTIHKL